MSILIMILLLSVLILVHEAGHFFAARLFKIKVDKFGFGLPFGPTLFEKKIGDTTILVHAFLLGGYVSFPDDEKDCDLPMDSPERFMNKPIWQRAIVVSAGVAANVVCAFLFVLLTAFLWGNLPSGIYEIIAAKNQDMCNSGLQNGDKIYSLNGEKINSIYAFMQIIKTSTSFDGKVDENLVRQNLANLQEINPAFKSDEILSKDIAIKLSQTTFEQPVLIDKMVLKGVTRSKDLQVKLTDKQKEIRDNLILNKKNYYETVGNESLEDIAAAMSDNYRSVTIVVDRGGKLIKLKEITVPKTGFIGVKIEARENLMKIKNIPSAFVLSTKYLYDNTYMLVYGLGQLFTGQVPLKDLHGIVAITKVGGDIIDNSGIFKGLLLIAIISMDLAIVNFLPIPALDGGHILFLIIEKIRRKPLDEKVINLIGSIGFGFLILLMFVVMYNDIVMLVTGK